MNLIKISRNRDKKYKFENKLRKITWGNGGERMENVICFEEYKQQQDNTIKSYSMLDMIISREKREKVYAYYDSVYKDTDEEKEICEAWRKRRVRKDEI